MVDVILINKSRRARTFNLPYTIIGDLALCERQLRGKVVVDTSGAKNVAPEHARLSKSITIRGKGKPGSEMTVPAEYLRAPEIQEALKPGGGLISKPAPQKETRVNSPTPSPDPKPDPAPEPAESKTQIKTPKRGGKR